MWSPCSPRDSQESSSAPKFKSISTSMLSLLYAPNLTCFLKRKSFSFWWSQIYQNLSFIDHTFSIILKKSLPNSKSQRFFSSVISYSFVLILSPVVHFKWIFVSSILWGLCSCSVLLFFLHVDSQCLTTICWKDFSLIESPSHFHKSKEKNKYHILMHTCGI